MKLKTWQKSILSAIVIVAGGFLLWNVAFLLAAVVMQLYRMVIMAVAGSDNPMFWKYVYVIFILLISAAILIPKRINKLVKATYLTMPLMVVLIVIGIQFYQYAKWVPIIFGTVIIGVVVSYLFKRKLSWQYYFATAYTGLMALYIVLSGIDI